MPTTTIAKIRPTLFTAGSRKGNTDFYQIDAVITEVAEYGGFNYDTAGFVIGAAMASSCRKHVKQFEAALGVEIM